MAKPFTHLGNMPVEEFLRDYWQQKPLLIRNAIPGFVSPISGEELAGMALEETVESRLVLENGSEGPWQLRTGPFSEEDFLSLPRSHWTLLVQAVDQWLSEVAALKEHFRFIPDWRLDDVMISYAADKGSVGPHFDYYDVFLLQAEGKRLWHQGAKANDDSPRVEGTPLNILRDFEAENSWLLEPGDMLYLPPQFSHWGIAEGPCTTISIGFRAPSAATILEDLAAELAQGLPQHLRYSDPGIAPARHPAEIDPASIIRLQEQLSSWLQQPHKVAQWLGAVMTEVKYPETVALDAGDAEDWRTQLSAGATLVLNPGSRCAFCREPQTLFVDGEPYSAPLPFIERFCENRVITQMDTDNFPELAANDGLIDQLVSQGSLIYPPEDF
ncbi:cupin domain-containing protein [Microbulbifer thermotolerans]|uniref:Cupin n=1 Tax=Microbulbifer thermotolerans TaxID=252514 RepID=A0A143HQW0_MICTH|nr:cupin domain-containing protein [Microbulbifer thermotolerans]AMX04134.1 cupin [Microbulbifer thermotolerans]MCX2779387.1 cupin domain-containing protein [Microbulbifer thermotolerans]MCX2782409.1 cupin domain-containing protein [Microbulbifer thermotolerans]MCX2794994.1 cupin domain-containing protein [Microbulbifer thermotolerans]MCX2800562.1 cupin domain-containing protein [Microbulbifer thermotolerans]